MRKSSVSLIAAASLFIAATALAAGGMTVVQQDKKFSEVEVTVHVGEKITFVNQDEVSHNVYSKTEGMSFDLGRQKPGDSSEISFDHPGEVDVLCAIHPQMKMKVKVEQ